MIIPMKKYTFLVYHRDYNRFLSELHELGVLHVIRNAGSDLPELRSLHDTLGLYTEAIQNLKAMRIPAGELKNDIDPETLLSLLQSKAQERETLQQNLIAYRKEASLLEPWGDFDWDRLQRLAEVGLEAEFFSCLRSRFREEWKSEHALSMINTEGAYVYFVVFHAPNTPAVIDAERVKLPSRSLHELRGLITDAERELAEIDTFLQECATSRLQTLESKRRHLLDRFDFEEARLNSQMEADDRLVILRGWVAIPMEKALVEHLEKTSVYYYAEDPQDGDNVPIMLKNNWFARLFEPIGKLYSLPSYAELDLTAFFAPFFMLFFGVCTADGGYGALMMLAAIFGLIKVKKPAVKPLLWLLAFLGLSTAINGLAQGTIFAYAANGLNVYRKIFHLPATEDITPLLFNQALLLGVIQVLFGVAVNFFSRIRSGFVNGVSMIGTFIIILCLSILGAPMVARNPVAFKAMLGPLSTYAGYGIWVGLFFVFFFNSPGKNVFLNFALGFWELYNIITGFFGDLLSYIRLFALGVSGGILGFVINEMAKQFGGMVPVVGPLIWLFIMVVGHLTNIALGSLGGFVHPMRLTFVEFYKNAGFSGGGVEYKPFAKNQ